MVEVALDAAVALVAIDRAVAEDPVAMVVVVVACGVPDKGEGEEPGDEGVVDALYVEWARKAARMFARNGRFVGILDDGRLPEERRGC